MGEIIAKLIDLIMPIINGKTALSIRMKTKSQLLSWWAILLVVQGALTTTFIYVWSKTRHWLELPLLPPWWLGTMEEFFTACVLFPFLIYLAACFFLNASYRSEEMGDEEFEYRSRRILKKFFISYGVISLISLTYIWFRWDLQQKLLDAYCWLRSLL